MSLKHLLGTSLPIIQAPMAGVQGVDLTIAVSQAGGLGSLPCAMLSPEQLRRALTAITCATAKPYNVNFFCHQLPGADSERNEAWQRALAPFYRQFGIVPSTQPAALRRPFGREQAAVLAEFEPPVVSFHFGLPAPELLAEVKRWGATILSSATTVAEAQWLEQNGVDAVIAQGLEAGGHRGMFLSDDLTEQLGTLALVPQVVGALKVPVIAAGGIADARGVTAALALGAAAVQIGTTYLLCPEVSTSAVHRAALSSAAPRVTALTNVFSGRPARSIVNRLVRELGPMCPQAPAFPHAAAALAPLRTAAERRGSGDFSALWAGQNSSGCKAIGAAELTHELAQGVAQEVV